VIQITRQRRDGKSSIVGIAFGPRLDGRAPR